MNPSGWRSLLLLGSALVVLFITLPVLGQPDDASASKAEAVRSWPPARLPDGQPDVQGIWQAVIDGTQSLTNPMSSNEDFRQTTGLKPREKRPSRIVDPPDGEVPYQPWARATQRAFLAASVRPTRVEHVDSK